jgi:hypothetical protein
MAAVVFSILVAGTVADRLAPRTTALGMHLLYGGICAGAMALVFWLLFGAPFLRREVERRKNSSGRSIQRPT